MFDPTTLFGHLFVHLLLQAVLRQWNTVGREIGNHCGHRECGGWLQYLLSRHRPKRQDLCAAVFRQARVSLRLPEALDQGEEYLSDLSTRHPNGFQSASARMKSMWSILIVILYALKEEWEHGIIKIDHGVLRRRLRLVNFYSSSHLLKW